MVSPIYRLVQAPLRSLAFVVFGGLTLAHASETLGALTTQAAAGVFPFVVLIALAATAALVSWRERHAADDGCRDLARYAPRVALGLLVIVCVLSAFGPRGGIGSALAFALLGFSLWRVSPDRSRLIEVHTKKSLISDSHVSAAH